MIISKVNESDIKEITALQESLLFSKHGNNNGFLVSAFSEEDYRHFTTVYEYFYKITDNDKIIGIIMAYNSKNILPEDKNNSLLKHVIKTEFVLIKQIFVSPQYFNQGIATKLYKHLFSLVEVHLPIVAVVVMEPFNVSSCEFHRKRGFIEFLNFVPDADADGIVRKRSAWVKPAQDGQSKADYIKICNVPDDSSRLSRSMFYRVKDFIALYRHEDNLNWTKMGMQSTILFALIAVVAYFFDKDIPRNAVIFIIILGFWGSIVNALFYFKIKSGVKYMNAYKEKIKEYDKLISFYHPKTNLIFHDTDFISRQSVTSRLLCIVSLIGLVFWVLLIVFLVLKALF